MILVLNVGGLSRTATAWLEGVSSQFPYLERLLNGSGIGGTLDEAFPVGKRTLLVLGSVDTDSCFHVFVGGLSTWNAFQLV